jgi:hypothetical protein
MFDIAIDYTGYTLYRMPLSVQKEYINGKGKGKVFPSTGLGGP